VRFAPIFFLFIGLSLLFAFVANRLGLVPWAAWLMGINVATLIAYGYDKSQAAEGGGRIPEAALHLLAVVGGTPGAFFGQEIFNHKTKAVGFRAVFFVIAAVQVAAVVVWWKYFR